MDRTGRRGFTLPELMVVIAIIALLAAIILPFFERAIAVQRKVACANHLEKIGQAFGTRSAQGATVGARRSEIAIVTWDKDLLGFLSGNTEVFTCPQDYKDSAQVGEVAKEKLKEVYIEVFQGAAGDYSKWLWDVPLDEDYSSEWVWRLSEEQFEVFSSTPGHGQNYSYAGYQEGEDPSTYWFVFEDQGALGGGDRDYYDILLKIHVTDTQIEVSPSPGDAGFNFTLCMGRGAEKEYLLTDMKSAANAGETAIISGGLGTSSYGINSVVNDLQMGTKKILVLDYELKVARGSDYDDPHAWLEDESMFPVNIVRGKRVPQFFRHFDKAHVLFTDGSVKAKAFDDITIYEDEVRQRYWNP